MNTNKRSTCVGCKFCPNTLQLNAAEHLISTKEDLKTYLLGLAKDNGHEDLGFLEEMAHCTGCYGSEEKCLAALLTTIEAAKELGFKGRFHYIGSEIKSKDAMEMLKESCETVWITFSIECFTKRNELLKSIKAANTIADYMAYMDTARECGIEATYIYVLGLDDLHTTITTMQKLAAHTTRFPIINIFQPHEAAHYGLMTPEAISGLEYYLTVRKALEEIYGDKYIPQSWNCYRPLWYKMYNGKPLECIRM